MNQSIAHDRKAREAFDRMTRAEVAQAVRDMKSMGFGDYGIAAATKLSVEAVRQLLSERRGKS